MWSGRVPISWAARNHAGWLAEQDADGEPVEAARGAAGGEPPG